MFLLITIGDGARVDRLPSPIFNNNKELSVDMSFVKLLK